MGNKKSLYWEAIFISTLKILGVLVMMIAFSRKEWHGVIIAMLFYIIIDMMNNSPYK